MTRAARVSTLAVLAACDPVQQDGLKDFFQQNGGEVKVFRLNVKLVRFVLLV